MACGLRNIRCRQPSTGKPEGLKNEIARTASFPPHGRGCGLGMCLLPLPISAPALTITQSDAQSTGGSLTASDSTVTGGSVSSDWSTATFGDFAKFDPAKGVLTGVTATLDSFGSFVQERTSPSVRGTTSLNVSWTLFGSTYSGTVASRTDIGTTSSVSQLIQPIAPTDRFVGTGNVSGSSSAAYSVAANKTQPSGGDNTVTAKYIPPATTAGNTVQTLTYDYRLHAAPSFDPSSPALEWSFDLGTLFQGDSVSTSVSIFNLPGDRVGLDFDGVSFESGVDIATLMTDLSLLSPVIAESDVMLEFLIDTSALGEFSATYLLNMSDEDVGAEASRLRQALHLTLSGTVVERQGVERLVGTGSVPEPGVLALLTAGLAGMGVARRKKRVA